MTDISEKTPNCPAVPRRGPETGSSRENYDVFKIFIARYELHQFMPVSPDQIVSPSPITDQSSRAGRFILLSIIR